MMKPSREVVGERTTRLVTPLTFPSLVPQARVVDEHHDPFHTRPHLPVVVIFGAGFAAHDELQGIVSFVLKPFERHLDCSRREGDCQSTTQSGAIHAMRFGGPPKLDQDLAGPVDLRAKGPDCSRLRSRRSECVWDPVSLPAQRRPAFEGLSGATSRHRLSTPPPPGHIAAVVGDPLGPRTHPRGIPGYHAELLATLSR